MCCLGSAGCVLVGLRSVSTWRGFGGSVSLAREGIVAYHSVTGLILPWGVFDFGLHLGFIWARLLSIVCAWDLAPVVCSAIDAFDPLAYTIFDLFGTLLVTPPITAQPLFHTLSAVLTVMVIAPLLSAEILWGYAQDLGNWLWIVVGAVLVRLLRWYNKRYVDRMLAKLQGSATSSDIHVFEEQPTVHVVLPDGTRLFSVQSGEVDQVLMGDLCLRAGAAEMCFGAESISFAVGTEMWSPDRVCNTETLGQWLRHLRCASNGDVNVTCILAAGPDSDWSTRVSPSSSCRERPPVILGRCES